MSDRGLWPVLRQAGGKDPLALGSAAQSQATADWKARTQGARVVKSICPYCAVGCGQNVYVKDEKIVHIEGDPDSPISRGRLCPKGSAIFGLTVNDQRWTVPKYRAPYSNEWVDVTMDWALDRNAEKYKAARDETFVHTGPDGKRRNHTLGIASLGGATFGLEENYLLQKLFKASGVVSIENQARV